MNNNTPDDDFSLTFLYKPFTNQKALVFIVVIGIIVFANSLANGFVWDDLIQIEKNAAIQSLSNIPKFFSGLNFDSGSTTHSIYPFYRPLTVTFFTILNAIFGLNAFLFHLFQVSLHIANAFLIFGIFNKFYKREISFLSALLFLVHPFVTESVVYASALGETLFMLFGLLAFVVLDRDELSKKRLFTGLVLLLCSLFSKETGALFIIAIPLYHFIFRRNNLKYILYPAFISGAIYLFFRFFVAKTFLLKAMEYPIVAASLKERILTIPAVVYYYIKTFFTQKIYLFPSIGW